MMDGRRRIVAARTSGLPVAQDDSHRGTARQPLTAAIRKWFDSSDPSWSAIGPRDDRVDWARVAPYLALHVAMLSVFLVGFSWTALGVALGLYAVRVFALTGFYHRYFSHRAFRASRAVQFAMAVAGLTAVQRGPLWWAAHHRHHHRYSDQAEDIHSPRRRGFWMSHTGWFLTPAGFRRRDQYIPDLLKFPELRWLDRFDWLVPAVLAIGLFAAGAWLEHRAPSLGTSGWQLLVWGFVVSTVAVYHVTYMVNSLAHRLGRPRFITGDDSRNSLIIALLTFGEGWHNNHHHFQASARQGFYWWEVDITYYLLYLLSWVGVVRDLKPVPAHALARDRVSA